LFLSTTLVAAHTDAKFLVFTILLFTKKYTIKTLFQEHS